MYELEQYQGGQGETLTDIDEVVRYGWRVAAAASALAALAAGGDALRVSPLAVLGVGVLIAPLAVLLARRSDDRTGEPRHSWPVAAWHAACWAVPALWVAWMLARGPWTREGATGWVLWAGGAVALGLTGRLLEAAEARHERRRAQFVAQAHAAEVERLAATPEAVAVRVEQEVLGQWRYWIFMVADKMDTEMVRQVPWDGDRTGYGYDVHGRLPGGGATLSLLAGRQEALEVHASRHGGVFAVEVRAGHTKADFTLSVAVVDALAEERAYPVQEVVRRSINDPITIGFHRDGSQAELWLRVATLLLQGKKRSGKALGLDTPLPTPTGWTTMGEVRVGDWLLDDAGRPTRVTFATEVQYGRPCYRVAFSDGTEIIADAEHRWLTESMAYRRALCARRGKAPTRQHVRRLVPEVVTTGQIRDTLEVWYGDDRYRNHAVRNAAPLALPAIDLPIDPYLLGAWLGDGTTLNAQITTADIEIVEAFQTAGYRLAAGALAGAARSYYVARGTATEAFLTLLRRTGLLGDKHVPAAYLRAGAEQRLALLQGLMDTDGTVGQSSNRCTFSVTSERLADAVAELVASLGWAATRSKRPAKLYGVEHGVAYQVSFRPTAQVFRVARKANRLRFDVARAEQHLRRFIVAVEPVTTVPVRCIQVDSPRHLFLAGRSMVPTHNTNTMHVGIAGICQTEDALSFVIDINKRGTLGSPWVRPWLTGQAPVPGVDWVAADWAEARRMTEFVLHLLECRQVAYQELLFAEDDDQLRVRPGIPKIIIWMDEVAEVLGSNVKPVDPKVAENIAAIIRVGGQMGVDVYLCGLRVTSDVIPQGLTTQAGAKVSMRVDDNIELAQMFDHKNNLSLADLTYQGCGFVWQESGRPRVFRAWRLTPSLIDYVVRATAAFRSEIDLGVVSDIYRDMYEKRWERVLPVMFPHLFPTGQRTLPGAPLTAQPTPARPDTGQDSRPDTRAPAPDTAGWTAPDSRAGEGDLDGPVDGGSLVEIAAALERLAAAGRPGSAPAEPAGEASATDPQDSPAGRPALRLLLQIEDDEDPPPPTTSKINDRERARRGRELIAAALVKAEFTGLTIAEIGELCEAAGLGVAESTYYRWAEAVAPGSPYGSYVHPQWRRSG